VERFRETQLKKIGARFAWDSEVQTTSPLYYKWTQWLFVKLYKAGLAERKKAAVNWCPSCLTVLADEQVGEGKCERCQTLVTQRELDQWFFKITQYTDRLLNNLDVLDWSDVVKTAQRNWIGRSEGLVFSLHIKDHDHKRLEVFTTRPDTMFGMSYVVLAPEHPLVLEIASGDQRQQVIRYIDSVRKKSQMERLTQAEGKTGAFTGAYAVNPITGEAVPVWVADYVLLGYGTGAIMAVPAHDERDFEFARAFDLPIKTVIIPPGQTSERSPSTGPSVYEQPGILVNSGAFTGLHSDAATEQVIEWFTAMGSGKRSVQYRLRDWLISRQRYWGPPIPIIYCPKCGTVPVPEDQLPVILPDLEDWMPKGTGSSPLAQVASFVNTQCPHCKAPARRETDVSDNFLDSAWYFLRYPSAKFETGAFNPELTSKWLPVDMYIGGPEHSVLHLLYSRFLTMALHDLGLVDFEEPFSHFRAHGHITKDGAKMSKSHGNVVNPDAYIEQFGADTLRIYLMFIGPFEHGGDFTDRGMAGTQRFLRRVCSLVSQHWKSGAAKPEPEAEVRLHRTIKKVTDDLASLKYNTAIAALMEHLNFLQKQPAVSQEEIKCFLLLLAPFAPHSCEELWNRVGGTYSIHQQQWPIVNPGLLDDTETVIAVQINGKTRGTVRLARGASEAEALTTITADPMIQRHLQDRHVQKTFFVPNRVLNIIVSSRPGV